MVGRTAGPRAEKTRLAGFRPSPDSRVPILRRRPRNPDLTLIRRDSGLRCIIRTLFMTENALYKVSHAIYIYSVNSSLGSVLKHQGTWSHDGRSDCSALPANGWLVRVRSREVGRDISCPESGAVRREVVCQTSVGRTGRWGTLSSVVIKTWGVECCHSGQRPHRPHRFGKGDHDSGRGAAERSCGCCGTLTSGAETRRNTPARRVVWLEVDVSASSPVVERHLAGRLHP